MPLGDQERVCPLCGEKLKTDEVPLKTLVAMKEAIEQEIAERA